MLLQSCVSAVFRVADKTMPVRCAEFGAMKFAVLRLVCGAVLISASLHAAASISIHGIVTSQGSGQPLQGATVNIAYNCGPSGCHGSDVLITGADGRYTSTNAQPGLTYIAAGYLPGQANYAPAEPQFFPVADGADETIDFALAPGVTIHGTLRRQADGVPVPNVYVELGSTSANYALNHAISDAEGKYTFTQLPADSYTLRTRMYGNSAYQDQFYAGYSLQPHQPADVLVLAPGQSATADFALVAGGRLLGTLIDQYSGLPIPDSDVSFQMLDSQADICCLDFDGRSAHTDAQGRFELDGLSDAPFYLAADGVGNASVAYDEWFYGCAWPCTTFKSASILQIAAGDTQDIDFLLYPAATITGTVTRRSDGKPIAWAYIEAYVPGPLALRTTYRYVHTDDQGHYRMDGAITPGVLLGVFDTAADGVSYVDQVWNNQDCWSGDCVGLGQYLAVPEGQLVSSIDFQLDAGASISGQVFGAAPYPGARIDIYAADGSMSTQVLTDPQGAFQTSGLQSGTYFLAASPFDQHFACTFYGAVPCHCASARPCVTPEIAASGATPIVLGNADITGISITVPANEIVFSNGFE